MEDFFLRVKHRYINFLLPFNIARNLMTSNDNGFVILQFLLTKSQFSAQDITRLKLLGRDAILLSEAPCLPGA